MYHNKILFSFLFISLFMGNASADKFTDVLQDIAVQTACLGKYSNVEAGIHSEKDPKDYYTPSMMAERFARMSKERTRIETFYGVCFDYANCAYDYIKENKGLYIKAGMLGNQFWIATSADNPNIIELSNPVSAEERQKIWNGVPVKIRSSNGYMNILNHGKVTIYHSWLWVQRYDGVWFWIDPTWTDIKGYPVYGYVGNGRGIQCRPNRNYCYNYYSGLDTLQTPPPAGSFFNKGTYRDPILVEGKGQIKDNQCIFWEFAMPKDSKNIEISCTSDAILHNIMTFALVPTIDDVNKFVQSCKGNNVSFHCVKNTYMKGAQSYYATVQDLIPGETYYFCAFKGSALLARVTYEIKCIIRTW